MDGQHSSVIGQLLYTPAIATPTGTLKAGACGITKPRLRPRHSGIDSILPRSHLNNPPSLLR